MPPKKGESSRLKRGRASAGEGPNDQKKPRRSERISSQLNTNHHQLQEDDSVTTTTPLANDNAQLPSPLTHKDSTTTECFRQGTVTPPEGRPSQIHHRTPGSSPPGLSSPPADTQPFSQFVYQSQLQSQAAGGQEDEDTWGYLIPMDKVLGDTLVLKKRVVCSSDAPTDDFGKGSGRRARGSHAGDTPRKEEDMYEDGKADGGYPSGGYLIGRHPECDRRIDLPTVSNRHCLIFQENKHDTGSVAILEDLSSNGTFVNENIVGRNQRQELENNDEITILDQTRFIFRYPKNRKTSGFRQQYRIVQQLGKGHFATVFLCIDRTTGTRYAVKRFDRKPGEKSAKSEGLEQEIGVLMSVSHPNLMCLKDTFDEDDGVYLILELASEGELFNWIVTNKKLSEDETRRVFIQLFQGMKYLHERGIVHRDIKPENILLFDRDLTVKIADFGLAKIIGEESFTTTLCGTPSYVAPEILENSRNRRYTKAVDVWSLGVVLYICLCGFPPFSDELYTPENPFTLSQQIKTARFDYPSPYWDSVGDPALDLIDRMLTVDPDKRASIDECLDHPWLRNSLQNGSNSNKVLSLTDSTDGLTGALGNLDFSKRKYARERTLLSSLNDVRVSHVVEVRAGCGTGGHVGAESGAKQSVKVWEKNGASNVDQPFQRNTNAKPKAAAAAAGGKGAGGGAQKNGVKTPGDGTGDDVQPRKEETPGHDRDPKEFMEMGYNPDQQLYPDEESQQQTRPLYGDGNKPPFGSEDSNYAARK